jgi:outer membrane protein assembly factor BamB
LVCSESQIDPELTLFRASDNDFTFLAADSAFAIAFFSTKPELRKLWAMIPGGETRAIYSDGKSGSVLTLSETDSAFVVRTFSTDSGLARSALEFPKKHYTGARLLSNSLLLLAEAGKIRLFSIGAIEGEQFSASIINADLESALFSRDRFVIYADGAWRVFDRLSGRQTRSFDRKSADALLGLDSTGRLFAAGESGEFLVFDADSGRLRWKFRSGGRILSAVEDRGRLIVSSMDNFIYSFDVERAKMIWKTRLTDRPLQTPILAGEVFFVVNQLNYGVEVHNRGNGRLLSRIQLENGTARIIGLLPYENGLLLVSSNRAYDFASACGK